MKKSTKVLLIIFGVLSISSGVRFYFLKEDTSDAYIGIFTGIALIVSVFLIKTKNKVV